MSRPRNALPLEPRPDWFDRARCHGLTRLFFSDDRGDQIEARRVCLACPVRAECEAWTIEQDTRTYRRDITGVSGGLRPVDRKRIQASPEMMERRGRWMYVAEVAS